MLMRGCGNGDAPCDPMSNSASKVGGGGGTKVNVSTVSAGTITTRSEDTLPPGRG